MILLQVTRGVETPQVAFEGGTWSGDERLLDWITGSVETGDSVLITPTGPEVPVTEQDPRSVLRLLERDFDAVTVTGEMPPWPYPGDEDVVQVAY